MNQNSYWLTGLVAICLICISMLARGQGNALDLDGSNDYVQVANNSAFELTDGTIEMWVKPDWVAGNKGSFPCLLSLRSNTAPIGTRYSFHINDNLDAIGLFNGFNYETVSFTFTQGQWYHIAFVESGTNTEVFIDGVSQGFTGNAFNTAASGQPLNIGWSFDTNLASEHFQGEIDEVRIWDDIRTSSEIANNRFVELRGDEANLVAYYDFNQGTAGGTNTLETSLSDRTSNNRNGTLNGFSLSGASSNWVTSTGEIKERASALEFDGINDYINVPDATSLDITTGSWEAWVKLESTGTVQMIIYKSDYEAFVLANGLFRAEVVASNGRHGVNSTTSAAVGTWQHVAATYDGSELTIYINGVAENSTTSPSGNINVSTIDLGLGSDGGGSALELDGELDEVRIWNDVRTCEEIAAYKDIELEGNEAGLVAYYDFSEGGINGINTGLVTLVDRSTNSNDGTLNNFTLTGTASNWVDGSANGVSSGSPGDFPEIALSGATDFGDVAINGSNFIDYTIDNTAGTGILTITNITSNNGLFTISNNPGTVAAGASATFRVTFAPTAGGAQNADITIVSDDCDEASVVVNFTGAGVTPPSATALDLDGVDDYVDCGNASAFNPNSILSMEAWVKFDDTSTDQEIVSKSSTNSGIEMLIYAGNLSFFAMNSVTDGSHVDYPMSNFTTGTWYHVAATWDGATKESMTLYVDGVSVGSRTDVGNFNALNPKLSNPSNNLLIGDWGGADRKFNGQIDEVRIWNHARSAAQISANKDNELTGNEEGLVAYFNFNQGLAGLDNTSETTLTDLSGNGNNGTLVGFTLTGNSSNWVDGSANNVGDAFTWNGTTWSPSSPSANNGGVIDGNYDVVTDGDLDLDGIVIKEGATLSLGGAGTVSNSGDLTNNGTFTATGGRFTFDGTHEGQSVNGNTRFFNLTIDNANDDVSISDSDTVWIDRLLDMQSGNLATSSANGAILILDATAARTAEVINGSGAVTGDGVIARQFIQGNFAGQAYRQLSSPVSGQTFADLRGPGFTLDLSQGTIFNANPDDTRLNSANYPNLFLYDPARATTGLDEGWYCPQPTDNILQARGMTVNIDRSENHGGIPLEFEGTLNNGNISTTISNPDADPTTGNLGWNLLGNPYPSSLSAAQFMATNSAVIDGAVYVFRSSSRFGGQYASRTAGGVVQNGFGTHIAPMQAFFVRSRVASGTVSFTNAMRPNSFLGTTHFRTEDDMDERYQGLLRLEARPVANPERNSEAVLVLHPEASKSYDDGHEAFLVQYNPKGWPTMHFQTADQDTAHLVINALATAQQAEETIREPLQLWIEEAGTHQISATEISHFAEGATVILEDQQEGIMHYFAMNPTYTFEIEEGFHADRFVIHLQNTYQTPTGLEQLAQQGINVSAVNHAVQVVFEQPIQAQVEVFDLVGRSLAKVQANQTRMDIPVGNHPAVILRIQTAEGLHTVKLLMNNQ